MTTKRIMKIIRINKALVVFLALIACNKAGDIVLSDDVKISALSDHILFTQSYEIPESVFRGALWPNKDRRSFKIWVIAKGKEIFFEILPPSEFINYRKEVTENWEIKETRFSGSKGSTIVYLAERKDGKRKFEVELPVKKRKYSFSVLENFVGEEMLIFMDISEDVVDKGLFGYVTIKSRQSSPQ